MLPGAHHCRYGEGGGEVDWLSALENWVEHGRAPDEVIAHHMKQEPYPSVASAGGDRRNTLMPRHPLDPGSYDRARPVYPYPEVARYRGGEPALPSSWIRDARK
jgi:feruloyl esterase